MEALWETGEKSLDFNVPGRFGKGMHPDADQARGHS